MTKVIILGEQPQEEKKLKPIEFTYCLDAGGLRETSCDPHDFDRVMLLKKSSKVSHLKNVDQFWAYNDDDPQNGFMFLGHFNDGVVE